MYIRVLIKYKYINNIWKFIYDTQILLKKYKYPFSKTGLSTTATLESLNNT